MLCLRILLTVGLLGFSASAARAVPMLDRDMDFTSTTAVRSATNDAPFTHTINLAGVNLYYSDYSGPINRSNGPVTAGMVHGIGFDNVDLWQADDMLGPISLTANAPGVTFSSHFDHGSDANGRVLNVSFTGADATALEQMATGMRYMSIPSGPHDPSVLTFGGLGVDRNVYIQLYGGSNDWSGQPTVTVNNELVGDWTTNPGPDTQASTFGFFALTDSLGQVVIDLDVLTGNFAGISGVTVLGEQSVPEPSTLLLLGLGASLGALVAYRKRRRG